MNFFLTAGGTWERFCLPPEVSRLPVAGETLVVTEPFHTLAGHGYAVGDELFLISRTEDAPHGIKCTLGNWVVGDKFFTSVWSNIELSISRGMLKIKEPENEAR